MPICRPPSSTRTYPIGGVASCTFEHTLMRDDVRPRKGPLMTLDPQIVTFVALAMAIGYTMLFSGLKKHALELKHRKRTCPSCGRHINGAVCREH